MGATQDHSLKLGGLLVDSDDLKYISGLSTILVATIQETKDRISQIEYIFCSQLFPSFQTKSKSLQKVYSEVRKAAAEDAWKERETNLHSQIEQLKRENQHILEENQSLKLEKERPLKEQEDKMNLLRSKLVDEQLKVEELSQQLKQKSREIDEGIEIEQKFLALLRSKTSTIMNKDIEIKKHEDQSNVLRAKLTSLETKCDELQRNLNEKMEEVSRVKSLEENLFKKIEFQASEIMNIEQVSNDQQKEKQVLVVKLEKLQQNVIDLQKELLKKTEETEEGRKLQTKLLQQIDLAGLEISRNRGQLEEFQKEKELLLAKLNCYQEKVDELKLNPRKIDNEGLEGNELYESLRLQIESKSRELLAEKKSRKTVVDAYKRLKSQYNFLCKKFGLTSDNMLLRNRRENETDSMAGDQIPASSPVDPEAETEEPFNASDAYQMEKEIIVCINTENKKGDKPIQSPKSHSPSFPIGSKRSPDVKSAPVASKKPACWRDTRTHQAQMGLDPHDDFLDTPLENIRENLNKPVKGTVQFVPEVITKDINLDGSDEETQDVNAAPSPQNHQQKPAPMAGNKGFKFVEPVRKKAERQSLKGIECKQCKKFYDAVLPNDGNGETTGDGPSLRCEHHDGVSRHRYRYAPPMTPEGFWNIGFESEM